MFYIAMGESQGSGRGRPQLSVSCCQTIRSGSVLFLSVRNVCFCLRSATSVSHYLQLSQCGPRCSQLSTDKTSLRQQRAAYNYMLLPEKFQNVLFSEPNGNKTGFFSWPLTLVKNFTLDLLFKDDNTQWKPIASTPLL